MIALVLAAVLSTFVPPEPLDLNTIQLPKMCLVKCKPKATKPKPKVVVKPPPPAPVCCAEKQQQKQEQHQQVIINILPPKPEPKAEAGPFPLGVGVRGAVGIHSCAPFVLGLVGVRARLLPVHLGLEANYGFGRGVGFMGLIYPIQGLLAWHLDAGVVTLFQTPLTSAGVVRDLDVAVGTGLELQILPHLSLTADYRYTFPDPMALTRPNVIAKNVMGNAFLRSQLFLGVMVHTW